MSNKWQCLLCAKIVSSKQKVELHLEKILFGSNKDSTAYKCVPKSKLKTVKDDSSKPKKSAYSSFSGLNNIFNEKSLLSKFSLYPPVKDSHKTPQIDVTLEDDIVQPTGDIVQTGEAESQLSDETVTVTSINNCESNEFPVPVIPVKPVFKVPVKSRNNCGCVGCLTDLCGLCYACTHKEAK